MSKITSKNLHYDTTLPPFLARLQANNSSHDGRHEFTVARPKKARNPEDEAEDEPVYFDEDTRETLTKGEWEEKQKEAEEESKPERKYIGEDDGENDVKEGKKKLANIGVSRKRKAGKVVGAEEERIAETSEYGPSTSKLAESNKEAQSKPKTAKKGKKIKLSFGDE